MLLTFNKVSNLIKPSLSLSIVHKMLTIFSILHSSGTFCNFRTSAISSSILINLLK